MCRAKRKDNNEWTYGYYYRIWDKSFLLWGMTNDVPNMIEVDENTVCKTIIEVDDNDKNIYFNDIVLCEGKNFKKYFIVDNNYKTIQAIQECWKLTVIGNIFDNPELIKKCVNGEKFL